MTYRQFRSVWLLGSPLRIGTSAYDPGRSKSSEELSPIVKMLPRLEWVEEPESWAGLVAQAGDMQVGRVATDGC